MSVAVVIPTLAADSAFADCLRSLALQSCRDFEVIVVDNSGVERVRRSNLIHFAVRVIENKENAGFGAAVNQAIRMSRTPFIATLNDDAVAHPEWLAALLRAAHSNPDAGMWASQVRLSPKGCLDSAGMLISRDGSSKQRGHLAPPERFANQEEVLCPSGSAALYRRRMLDEIGTFDESFFLYCEDTDLGLRARRAGWRCLYVPDAIVDHRYSHSAGRASALKAYYVERNRLFLVVKNFPLRQALAVPLVSITRYFWHVVSILRRQGAAAEFSNGGSALPLLWFVMKAHLATFFRLGALLLKRRGIQKRARMSEAEFAELLRQHSITAKQVALL
ncbi:MAG: glycosyltransferase family 2 protein [Bryobacteraceae bacterium]